MIEFGWFMCGFITGILITTTIIEIFLINKKKTDKGEGK